MAVTVTTAIGNLANIETKLQELITSASPTTIHTATIVRLHGSDYLLALLVYE